MRRGLIYPLLGAALVVALALPLYARNQAQPPGGGGPRVVASTSVLADLVWQVGGERLGALQSVVPPGAEVEDYNPTPDNLRAIAQSDVLVINGLALDRWVPDLVGAARPDIATLVLSAGLPVLGVGASDDQDIAQNGNPHFWLDVQYAKVYVQRIHDQLVAQDPDGTAVYDARATAYLARLDELDAWIVAQVGGLPAERRKLVSFHDALPYFAARYGFEVVGVITPTPGQEPSAGELAQLVRDVRAAQVQAVFGEAASSPRLIETLAAEAGITEVVTDLYTDSLGEAPADSYIGMMRFNVERIVHALQ